MNGLDWFFLALARTNPKTENQSFSGARGPEEILFCRFFDEFGLRAGLCPYEFCQKLGNFAAKTMQTIHDFLPKRGQNPSCLFFKQQLFQKIIICFSCNFSVTKRTFAQMLCIAGDDFLHRKQCAKPQICGLCCYFLFVVAKRR